VIRISLVTKGEKIKTIQRHEQDSLIQLLRGYNVDIVIVDGVLPGEELLTVLHSTVATKAGHILIL